MKTVLKKDQAKQLRTYGDLYPIMQQVLMRQDKLRRSVEHLWVVSLNHKLWIQNIELINIGSANRVHTQPPEIFRVPIYKASANVILVHNHPSGSLVPSQSDKDFTDKMMKVGLLLNIKVIDHQIITEKGFYSFAAEGIMKALAKSGLYEVTQKESEEVKAWKLEVERKKGADEAKRVMALSLLKDGLPIDFIVKHTGLRKASVEKMRREMGR